MKKVLFAFISICLAVSAAVAPLSVSAAKELAMPEYPEDIFEYPLSFKNLTDFAIASDNQMLFADDGALIYWENQIKTVFTLEASVTDVDYENGTFYYSLNGGETSYTLPNPVGDKLPENPEPDKHVYPTEDEINVFEGYHYYYTNNGEESRALFVLDEVENTTSELGNFIKVKVYNGKLYGSIKTSAGDTYFHKITGNISNAVKITYSNYNKLTEISVGDVPEKLKATASENNIRFVQIENNAFITELNINYLVSYGSDGNPYFSVIEPNNTHAELRGKTALLLCEAGNVRIVSYGKSAYIVKADCTTAPQELEFVDVGTKATFNGFSEYAHSLPYMSNATRTFEIAHNEEVRVLYKFSKDTSGIFLHDYYLIQNSDGEQGYVVAEYLNFNQPPVNESQSSDISSAPTYDNSVKIVILVILVIALALTAVGYITWISTSGKRKAVNNKNGEEIDLNDKSPKDK